MAGLSASHYRRQRIFYKRCASLQCKQLRARSHIELIEWYYRVPIELRDRIGDRFLGQFTAEVRLSPDEPTLLSEQGS